MLSFEKKKSWHKKEKIALMEDSLFLVLNASLNIKGKEKDGLV